MIMNPFPLPKKFRSATPLYNNTLQKPEENTEISQGKVSLGEVLLILTKTSKKLYPEVGKPFIQSIQSFISSRSGKNTFLKRQYCLKK